MALQTNYTCTYAELRDFALQQIKAKCKNIDSITASISVNNTITKNIPTNGSVGDGVAHLSAFGNAYYGGARGGGRRAYDMSFYIKLNTDSFLTTPVPTSTVENEFDTYMNDRGMKDREDTVLSFKAMLNFFQNVASFMHVKIVQLYSPHQANNKTVFYYRSAGVPVNGIDNMPTVTHDTEPITYYRPVQPFDIDNPAYEEVTVYTPTSDFDSEISLTNTEVQNSVSSYMNSINKLEGLYAVSTYYQLTCSSCSSSCSSSSSSCSSSSSAFIVYMDI